MAGAHSRATMYSPNVAGRESSRRRPELNINTSPSTSRDRNDDFGDQLPSTPPPRSSRKQHSSSKAVKSTSSHRTPRAPARDARDMESFLDGLTPVDSSNKENTRPTEPRQPSYRDSHDLSLPARQVTRDSLVTNMLLSLDQFSMGQGQLSTYEENKDAMEAPTVYDEPQRTMTFPTKSSRSNGHGHGHGYSYSSDYEGGEPDGRVTRGRRSNSSSGFQASLGRINSMREASHQSPGTTRQPHTRSGKGSKSSSTNSIDQGYVQVLSSQRWASGFGGSSSSPDQGQAQERAPTTATDSGPQAPWHIEFSNTFFNDELDAAPTPTVPGGPRRLATVPSLPVLPVSEPKSPHKAMGRKRSTTSSKSASVGRKADAKLLNARDAPPMPPFSLETAAPAPHVGYEKAKEPPAPVGSTTPSMPAKEKQGFFRRMFGSSKNNMASPQPSPASPNLSVGEKRSSPPSRESHHSSAPRAQTLTKKTSSFFRRRKFSITESEPPPLPMPPMVLPTARLPAKEMIVVKPDRPEPSPITSLRKAMNPFLAGDPDTPEASTPLGHPSPLSQEQSPPLALVQTPPLKQTQSPPLQQDQSSASAEDIRQHSADQQRATRGFSPEYEPSPSALIRTVDAEKEVEEHDSPSRQPPRAPVMGRSDSFFNDDNSDDEPSPRRPTAQEMESSGEDIGLSISGVDRLSPKDSMTSLKQFGNSMTTSGATLSPVASRDDGRKESSIALPIQDGDGTLASPTDSMYHSAVSLPSVVIDAAEPTSRLKSAKSIDEPDYIMGEPTEDDRQKAQRIYDGNEDFIQRDKAAAWMGEEGPVRQRTLLAYMDLYDFKEKSIVTSLRQVCNRLVLRAETQQVDRILVAFSKRWCDCNPNHGFKHMDIIHTICYSIMLLNTDLHVADIESKMTRSQFVKNTMTTIKQALGDAAPAAFDKRASILPGKGQGQNLDVDTASRSSFDHQDRPMSFRHSFMPPPRPESALGHSPNPSDRCGPLVKTPFDGPLRAWEAQVEVVLKDIYASIRDERLPLFGAESTQANTPGGLSVMGMLKRSPSVLSKAPSENLSTRGRITGDPRQTASRWTSSSRSRQRPFGGNGFSSSRTSFEDGDSIWSPTESSATWSRYSLGRTHTSMSMNSFGSGNAHGDYQSSIGFANALSQAIIREDHPEYNVDEDKPAQLIEDESLELAGPPWVKEGMVVHKHHLDGVDKRAKDRNWTQVFAVVQKGQMSLFSFNSGKTLRNKRSRLAGGGTVGKGTVVGGGNWQDNATNVGTFSLKQTIASSLPPPGYSRARPHVWALSLPTGAVHMFQVGTPEISKEFVTTANYWSARLSTHPLVGGISNIEYGWSDAVISNAAMQSISESTTNLPARPGTSMSTNTKRGHAHSRSGSMANTTALGQIASRTSIQSRGSGRSSSFDVPRPGSGSSAALPGSVSRHGKLPGDRLHIAEWTPPAQSLRASSATERDQLAILETYVRGIEQELQTHNSLRSPMLLAFTPRSGNAVKAMANWQRKSEYLLREIVKFRTYVDCLKQAELRKREVLGERENARRAAVGDDMHSDSGSDDDDDDESDGEEAADETIRPE